MMHDELDRSEGVSRAPWKKLRSQAGTSPLFQARVIDERRQKTL